MNYGDHIIPLMIAKQHINTECIPPRINNTIDRYAGVAFYTSDNGDLATCKHIIEMVQANEVLVGKNLNTGELAVISNIKVHPTYDFAIAKFNKNQNSQPLQIEDTAYLPGHDVRAFGFTHSGKDENIVKVDPRLFKGHIVRTSEDSEKDFAKSTMELSFPSHKGFSGGPLVSEQTGKIVGMLYGNQESSIEIHSFLDVDENGDKYQEGMYRIIELGLAHSAQDLISFSLELESC